MPATLHHGDCLDVLHDLEPLQADLVYMDPPFGVGRQMSGRDGTHFDDLLDDPIEYMGFMRPRLESVLRHLHEDGILLLHCDWRQVHHLRLTLDELMGRDAFVNQLVWRYGLGGSSPRRFARKHDDILFYAKSPSYYFKPPLVPATSQRLKGQMKKATDVLDIPSINNMAHERTGWPTQKPIDLLKMLVEACCPESGHVLDPFCGSGTTLVAAVTTGRQATGIDRSEEALAITGERLAECDAGISKDPSR
ncbi:MAG: site-specific DNA-methyltransferase [Phycisphaerales bacterium]|nr:site-specific DNA-methyltransferase [Phycisphaerales bacterium]